MLLKDAVLDDLVKHGVNVAQFVSFSPKDGKKRFCRIRGVEPTKRFASIEEAVQTLQDAGARIVNIRTLKPEQPEGNDFLRGEKEKWPSVVAIADVVRNYLRKNFVVIVNENIPVDDGGFSGVIMGEIAEFAPCDTPRCVENPGCAVLSRLLMDRLVQIVYGNRIGFPYSRNHRIEFSVHPGPVGYFRHPQIVWEEEKIERGTGPLATSPRWPNRYSAIMGDKAYGLLMAHLHGFSVPYSRISGRIIPPFEFGESTNSQEVRMVRSCPKLKTEGKFFTNFGWLDVVTKMQREDPDGVLIASYIEQDRVDARFSGKVLTDAAGKPIIEGVSGSGEAFMVGSVGPVPLPVFVTDRVTHLWEKATTHFGPVEFEWVYDDRNRLWIVQFHAEQSASSGDVIHHGDAPVWKRFIVPGKLKEFRTFVMRAKQENFGIVLVGDVGITSHFGGILRDEHIPSRLERPAETKIA